MRVGEGALNAGSGASRRISGKKCGLELEHAPEGADGVEVTCS